MSKKVIAPRVSSSLPHRGNAFSRWFGRTMLRLTGWRVEGEFPDVPQCVFIGAPHTSNKDFFTCAFMMFATGVSISWMGKHSLFRFPLKNLMLWLGGISTVRNSNLGMVDQQIEAFKRYPKFLLGISPEGTRKKVTEWKTGFHRIAHQANVPVFPFYWDYPRKTIILAPLFYTTDDMEKDIAELRAFFKEHAVGAIPANGD